ncbi:MAG: hypothetical protein NTW38_00165 [Candidatus Aminicenantes bacterium]|nr:hypothetical protein [Candidatus Aminicenantes bacterium]
MRFTPARLLLIILSFACLFTPPLLCALTPANPWSQVRLEAKLPVDTQVQAHMQQWFIAKIQAYQHVLDDTAIGQANPRIVNLGDWAAFYQQILAPPTGKGPTRISFGNVGAPSTMEDRGDIIFPQASSDAYIDGHPDSCWHEFNHAIVILREQNGTHVAIPRSPWMVYAKPGDDRNVEHIYMEGLGELTTEWLDLLLHEHSALTGGAGMGFEKYAREACEQTRQYQARGETISYAVEYSCWSKAHDAYCRAWEQTGHLIAPLPLNYRQDYQQICGVWVGFVEDIITFYMQGGLKAADGKPIHIPEWVMNPDPMKAGIIVGHLNEIKEIKGDMLRYGFDVRVMENYRHKEHSDSLNHGKVLITLENADADTGIELAVDGKPIKRSGNAGKIDLTGFKKDSKIRVTLVRGKLSTCVGKIRYQITVDYQPDPRIENGVQKPPFYYPSRAFYYIDVTGSGTNPSTSKPPSSSSTSGTNPPPQSAGVWRLTKIVKKKVLPQSTGGNPGYTQEVTLEDTSVEITVTGHVSGPPPRTVIVRSKHTWDHPGTTLIPKTMVPVKIAGKDNGSSGYDNLASGSNAATYVKAWIITKIGGQEYGLFTSISGSRDQDGGGISFVCGGNRNSSELRTIQMPIEEGSPGDQLIVLVGSRDTSYTIGADVEYHYVYEQGPQPAGKADASLTAEETPPEPEPAGMDNVPPKPGEVVKIPQTKENQPPVKPHPPITTEQWYTHAEGDYKFKLPKGWKISAKHFFDETSAEYDTIWPADEGLAIICSRAYTLNGAKSDDEMLKEFTAKMLKDNPGAPSMRLKYGEALAVQIADYDEDARVMHWNVTLSYKGRSYFISVCLPSPSAPAKMPDPPAWMLGSLVILR